jgi:hypothetical protein
MSENYAQQFIAKGGAKFDLSKCPTEVDIFSGKSSARAAIKDNAKAIQPLAHKLYGEAERSLLIAASRQPIKLSSAMNKSTILKST